MSLTDAAVGEHLTSSAATTRGRDRCHTSVIAMPSLSLRANVSWSLVANGLYLASQWGMLTVIAKLGSPEMVGQFALAMAVTAPIVLFCNLNLRVVQATDASRQYAFADYFSLRCVTSVLAAAIVVTVVLLAGYRWETSVVVLAVGAAKLVESLSDVFHGLYQQRQRMDAAGRSTIAKAFCSVVAIATGVFFTQSVFWAVVLLGCGWAVLLIACDYRSGARILRRDHHDRTFTILRWAPKTWRTLVLLTFPAGLVALLDSVLYLVPRYVIESELGEAPLGMFAALAYISVAGHGMIAALTSSTSARLAWHYSQGDRASFCSLTFKAVSAASVAAGAAVALSIVAGEQILATLYTPEYAIHADVLVWLMAGGAVTFVHHLFWNSVNAARRLALQVPIFTAAVVVAFVASANLVPRFGLTGAAAATCVAGCVQLAGMIALFAWTVRTCPADAFRGETHAERSIQSRRDIQAISRQYEGSLEAPGPPHER